MVYFDLNIKSQDVTKREFMSSEIEKCGYKCIALNYECHVGERPVDVEKMAPFDHLNPQIRQLKRLTLHMDSMTSVYSLVSCSVISLVFILTLPRHLRINSCNRTI